MEVTLTKCRIRGCRAYRRYPLESLNNVQLEFIAAAFGVTSDESIREGINMYTRRIGQQMEKFSFASDPHSILNSLLPPIMPLEDRLFIIATKAAGLLKEIQQQSSIDDLARDLIAAIQPPGMALAHIADISGVHNLIFACIGWTSMLFMAHRDLSGAPFQLDEAMAALARTATFPNRPTFNLAERPLGAALGERRLFPINFAPVNPFQHQNQASKQSLVVSNINCYSLSGIGKLSIIWDDTVANHCRFDRNEKRLYLFRFPAFFLHACSSGATDSVLTRIISAEACRQCPQQHPSATNIHGFFGEFLLSYRILFGLDKRSRKIFRDKEALRAGHDGFLDPTLILLAGRKNPSEIINQLPYLRDEDAFVVETDFPQLGPRLLELQTYVIEQRPTTLRDMLHDHRDTHVFYAFWVVVVIGSISIILQFVQFVISIAQLVYAVRQVNAM